MDRLFPIRRRRLMAHGATAALLAILAGCNRAQPVASGALAPLPLAAGAAPVSAPAPTGAALPLAPPVRVTRLRTADRYAYPDRAYAFSSALGDAPPDYTYDYRGERPWVWRSQDGYQRFAERLPDGRMRYYYYAPGADEPYLIQDPNYDYAYSNGALAGVYDDRGVALADYAAQARAAQAGRYLAWATGLYAAAQAQQHESVYQANWSRERGAIYNDQLHWQDRQSQNADWAAYHQAHLDDNTSYWAAEQARRAGQAAGYAQAVGDAAALGRAQQAQQQAAAIRPGRSGFAAPGPGPGAGAGPVGPPPATYAVQPQARPAEPGFQGSRPPYAAANGGPAPIRPDAARPFPGPEGVRDAAAPTPGEHRRGPGGFVGQGPPQAASPVAPPPASRPAVVEQTHTMTTRPAEPARPPQMARPERAMRAEPSAPMRPATMRPVLPPAFVRPQPAVHAVVPAAPAPPHAPPAARPSPEPHAAGSGAPPHGPPGADRGDHDHGPHAHDRPN